MTLFFNIEVLEKETKGDLNYLIIGLEKWFNKQYLPLNSREKYKPLKRSLSGYSFLLQPEPFFKDKTTDIIYRVQYLRLASRRDYTQYKLYGSKSLDLSFLPDINIHVIESNPIILIKQNKIYFKYEEN